MTSQLTGHFQSFFIYFFRPPDPRSEKKSRKSTNKNKKKSGPTVLRCTPVSSHY